MATTLTSVKVALEALTDIELRALIVASNEVPQIAQLDRGLWQRIHESHTPDATARKQLCDQRVQ